MLNWMHSEEKNCEDRKVDLFIYILKIQTREESQPQEKTFNKGNTDSLPEAKGLLGGDSFETVSLNILSTCHSTVNFAN